MHKFIIIKVPDRALVTGLSVNFNFAYRKSLEFVGGIVSHYSVSCYIHMYSIWTDWLCLVQINHVHPR